MFLDTIAIIPTQAAQRVKRAPVEEEHFAAPRLLARVMARLRGLSRFSLSGRRGDRPLGRLLSSQEFRMHGVEVFRLLQDFLVAEQPFLLAKLNPQFLKASKYSTASCVLGPLYGSGTFSRHLPDICRRIRAIGMAWIDGQGRPASQPGSAGGSKAPPTSTICSSSGSGQIRSCGQRSARCTLVNHSCCVRKQH